MTLVYDVMCQVCETIYEEAKGMVGIQKRGCKNRNACKAGPQGKKRCQLCCEGDYCNDGNPNQFTYGSLVDECIVDYTVGGDTMPNSCGQYGKCDAEAQIWCFSCASWIKSCVYSWKQIQSPQSVMLKPSPNASITSTMRSFSSLRPALDLTTATSAGKVWH